jgi:hypothetical protein
MIKYLFIIFLLFTLIQVKAQNYPGTNVRGQIITQNPWGQQVPFVSAKVDLYIFNTGVNQWQYLSTSYSNNYGFFFFNYLPINNYSISINGSRSYNIQVIFIDYRFYQFQDLGTFFF